MVLSATLLVAGAMVGRGLSVRLASVAALVISLLIAALTVWYYKLNVNPPVSAEYGLYVGAVGAACAVVCSIWAVTLRQPTAGRAGGEVQADGNSWLPDAPLSSGSLTPYTKGANTTSRPSGSR